MLSWSVNSPTFPASPKGAETLVLVGKRGKLVEKGHRLGVVALVKSDAGELLLRTADEPTASRGSIRSRSAMPLRSRFGWRILPQGGGLAGNPHVSAVGGDQQRLLPHDQSGGPPTAKAAARQATAAHGRRRLVSPPAAVITAASCRVTSSRGPAGSEAAGRPLAEISAAFRAVFLLNPPQLAEQFRGRWRNAATDPWPASGERCGTAPAADRAGATPAAAAASSGVAPPRPGPSRPQTAACR